MISNHCVCFCSGAVAESVEDTRTLTAFTSVPGVAGHFRTTLPREDYPQLYALKGEILEIQDLVAKRKAAGRKR